MSDSTCRFYYIGASCAATSILAYLPSLLSSGLHCFDVFVCWQRIDLCRGDTSPTDAADSYGALGDKCSREFTSEFHVEDPDHTTSLVIREAHDAKSEAIDQDESAETARCDTRPTIDVFSRS